MTAGSAPPGSQRVVHQVGQLGWQLNALVVAARKSEGATRPRHPSVDVGAGLPASVELFGRHRQATGRGGQPAATAVGQPGILGVLHGLRMAGAVSTGSSLGRRVNPDRALVGAELYSPTSFLWTLDYRSGGWDGRTMVEHHGHARAGPLRPVDPPTTFTARDLERHVSRPPETDPRHAPTSGSELLWLQRTAGNRAASGLLRAADRTPSLVVQRGPGAPAPAAGASPPAPPVPATAPTDGRIGFVREEGLNLR